MNQVQDSNVADALSTGSCGNGFYNCGGVCVPYPCPRIESEPYIHLQVVLDALETHAKRYLEGDEATKEARKTAILQALQPALELVGAYAKEPSTST